MLTIPQTKPYVLRYYINRLPFKQICTGIVTQLVRLAEHKDEGVGWKTHNRPVTHEAIRKDLEIPRYRINQQHTRTRTALRTTYKEANGQKQLTHTLSSSKITGQAGHSTKRIRKACKQNLSIPTAVAQRSDVRRG